MITSQANNYTIDLAPAAPALSIELDGDNIGAFSILSPHELFEIGFASSLVECGNSFWSTIDW